MAGHFFFVVGPSGAGKDSLLSGVKPLLPAEAFVFARRVITRSMQAESEDHDTCSREVFLAREQNGDFLITWQAHGLHYGLPRNLLDALARGVHVVANGSRNMIEVLQRTVPSLRVIEVTAPEAVLRSRLQARNRETASDIEARLQRATLPLPEGCVTARVVNDVSLEIGVSRAKAILLSHVHETPALDRWLFQKIMGQTLPDDAYAQLLPAIIQGRYALPDVQAFLIACTQRLTEAEVIAITRARTLLYPRIAWPKPMVVDKHSMGGTPGSRVTMVVVPIVAAHGLLIPKTSSRAITSAAGTADAMEVLARVDLDFDAVQRCVQQTNGCIAWNGKLNHSVLDDAMNVMVKPLGLDTRSWSVASILSKKYTAGATHVVIDIPYADNGKVKTEEEAQALGALFERVGHAIGLVVRAFATDGNAPIGHGIGPALEARDVLHVLDNHPDAPADLRNKALFFASQILALDHTVGSVAAAQARANALLASGQARQRLDAIVAAQGVQATSVHAPVHQRTVRAARTGVVRRIEGQVIANLARTAGAPKLPHAGVDLKKQVGERVAQGEVLFVLQSPHPDPLERAYHDACQHCGFEISA